MKDKIGLIVLGVIVLVIGLAIVFSPDTTDMYISDGGVAEGSPDQYLTDIVEVSVDEFIDIMNGSELSILYVMSVNCGYCVEFGPILNKVAVDNELEVSYIDLSKIATAQEQEKFFTSNDYFLGEFGTPMTVIVQNGTFIDVIPGYVEEAQIIEFFTANNIID